MDKFYCMFLLNYREEAQQKEDVSPEREVSVAERIFQMHNKIEEVKSCPITPKARSGFATPKSAVQRYAISRYFLTRKFST